MKGEDNASSEDLWLEEIVRETDHYYQGEIQQEQRASWILASVCVFLALLIGIQLQSGNTLKSPSFLGPLAQITFCLSGISSIIAIFPLRGTGIRRDMFGQSYRKYKSMNARETIEKKFRPGENWSKEDYKERLFHHFRAHFLRVRWKEYGVVWSTIFLVLGFLFLGIIGLIELISN